MMSYQPQLLNPHDEISRASVDIAASHLNHQAEAIALQKKSFQFAAHYRPEYNYSGFHENLDVSLKFFYSRKNLEKIVINKGYLTETTLHRLDNAIVDVWYAVVFLKVPATIPYRLGLCKFISKRDFLNELYKNAIASASEVPSVGCHRNKVVDFYAKSASTGEFYDLLLEEECVSCSCKSYSLLGVALGEDVKMLQLLQSHPILQGQRPCKHAIAVWGKLGASSFGEYQQYFKEHVARSQLIAELQKQLKEHGLSLRPTLSGGHFDVWAVSGKIGSLHQELDLANSYWVNKKRLPKLRDSFVPGDGIQYGTPEEAALGLAKFMNLIVDSDRAAADIFGGGWGTAPEEHLVEENSNFCDEQDDLRLASDFESGKSESEWLSLEAFQ